MAKKELTVDELQEQLAAANAQAAQAEKDRDTERAARGKAEQELLDANKLLDDLNQTAEAAPAAASAAPVVELGTGTDKRQYRVVLPAFALMDGRQLTAADVKSNSDVLHHLVEIGSAAVELVEAA